MVSVFGDVTRSGSWGSNAKLLPIALFGDVELDLRQADIGAGDLVITAVAPFGDIELLVPNGIDVDLGGFTVFGSKKADVKEISSGSAPVVRVRAFSVFGSARARST